MSEVGVTTVKITDEGSLWDALARALSHKGDRLPFLVDFSDCTWASIKIKYEGKQFRSSLTPSAMRGIVELQASLYRAAAIILKDDANVRKLNRQERQELELTFVIKDGSSDTEGDGKGFLQAITQALSTMTSTHKLIAVLVLGALYFGVPGINHYIDAELQRDEKEAILQHDQYTEQLLARSLSHSSAAASVAMQSDKGFDSVIRHSGNVRSLTIQGVKLPRETVEQIKSHTRRESKNIDIRGDFTIVLVNPTDPEGYTVRLESVRTGKKFNAIIYDSLVSGRTKTIIKNAEWSKSPVRLHITARLIGDDIVDARIIAASGVRRRSKGLSVYTPVLRESAITGPSAGTRTTAC